MTDISAAVSNREYQHEQPSDVLAASTSGDFTRQENHIMLRSTASLLDSESHINALTGAGTRNGDSGKPWQDFDPTSKRSALGNTECFD